MREILLIFSLAIVTQESFQVKLFLVGAFINKRARLLQSLVWSSFFFKTDSKRRNFCSVVQLNEYVGSASQRAPFQFLLFKRNIQNRMRLNETSLFFDAVRFFFRNCFLPSKCPPFDFIEVPS